MFSPGGDLLGMLNLGLATSYKVNGSHLNPGTRYYFTVMATNGVGMMTSLSSDGVLIDNDKPISGEVYNTDNFNDVHVSSNNLEFAVSWQGFDDHHSYIKSYMIEVFESTTNRTIVKEHTRGMLTSTIIQNITLQQGKTYRSSVSAFDAVGHRSEKIYSRDILIDTTPPEMSVCQEYSVLQTKVIKHLNRLEGPYVGYIQRNLSLKAYTTYEITVNFYNTTGLNTANLQIDTEALTLFLTTNVNRSRSSTFEFRHNELDKTVDVMLLLPRQYVDASLEITFSKCVSEEHSSVGAAVTLHQLGPSALSIHNLIHDDESGIYEVLVGTGTTRGGFELRELSPLSKYSHTVIFLEVQHGNPVYVTCIGINAAGSRSVFYSNPIIIDHTPPTVQIVSLQLLDRQVETSDNITTLNNTRLYNMSSSENSTSYHIVNFVNTTDLNITFKFKENESTIEYCLCMMSE